MAATQWPQATADERAAASTIGNFMYQPSECEAVCVLYNEYICNICFHFIHLKCCVTFHNVAAETATKRSTVICRFNTSADGSLLACMSAI